MLYKRKLFTKGNKEGNNTIDYIDSKIDTLPFIVVTGSNTSRNQKQSSVKQFSMMRNKNTISIINQNSLSSTIDTQCCLPYDNIQMSYRCKKLTYNGKTINDSLFYRKKTECLKMIKYKIPIKFPKYISTINKSHLTIRNLPKLTILNPKFCIKKSINFQNTLLQNKLQYFDL